jgi:hypothetical protein
MRSIIGENRQLLPSASKESPSSGRGAGGVCPARKLIGIQLGAGGVRHACEQIAVVRGVHNTPLHLPTMGDYSILFFFFFFFFFFFVVVVAAHSIDLGGEGQERQCRTRGCGARCCLTSTADDRIDGILLSFN